VHTVEDIRELARMHGGRGFSRSSEKLNQPSECEQSEYERDEFILLTYAPYTPPFGVALADVLEARKQLFGSSEKIFDTSVYPVCLPLRFQPHPLADRGSRLNQEGFLITEAA
jgi:hypothetical protein